MKPTVDVWVGLRAAATLAPPPQSIINGDASAVTVRTCVLRRPLQRRIEMTLTVDAATAAQFSRSCQRQLTSERIVLPLGVLAALTLGISGQVLDSQAPHLTSIIAITLAGAILIGRRVMMSADSRHHPRLKGRGTVIIRDVDRTTAYAWVRLNAPEAICIVD